MSDESAKQERRNAYELMPQILEAIPLDGDFHSVSELSEKLDVNYATMKKCILLLKKIRSYPKKFLFEVHGGGKISVKAVLPKSSGIMRLLEEEQEQVEVGAV